MPLFMYVTNVLCTVIILGSKKLGLVTINFILIVNFWKIND